MLHIYATASIKTQSNGIKDLGNINQIMLHHVQQRPTKKVSNTTTLTTALIHQISNESVTWQKWHYISPISLSYFTNKSYNVDNKVQPPICISTSWLQTIQHSKKIRARIHLKHNSKQCICWKLYFTFPCHQRKNQDIDCQTKLWDRLIN